MMQVHILLVYFELRLFSPFYSLIIKMFSCYIVEVWEHRNTHTRHTIPNYQLPNPLVYDQL